MRSQLLDEVRRFIRRERMLEPGEPLAVAVSGGVDSMVLLSVLRKLGHACTVLHVDHGLRGAESAADLAFVAEHCRREGIPFKSSAVDAAARAKQKGISVQMAARELRYTFFAEATESNVKTALAHHADDAVETLLLHLLRGTGIAGWGAIKPVAGCFVRPLLSVHRDAITLYAQEHGVAFREDPSNADAKYLRNRIRHEVLPLLEDLRPGAARTMARSLEVLRELEVLGTAAGPKELTATHPQGFRVPLPALLESGAPLVVLYRWLRPLGFHPDTLMRIRDGALERSTGAVFRAGIWKALIDRDHLVVTQAQDGAPIVVIDAEPGSGHAHGFYWRLSEGEPFEAPEGMHEVVLDADCLDFPVELRPWQAGDRMRPIGLGGSKLVSDILIDAKVPRNEKDLTYVLVSGGQVAWLAGHRVGEGFHASEESERVLRVRMG